MSVQINPTLEMKPIAYIDQADPTLDKYYSVATVALGEVFALTLEQTNDETDNKDIEILVTIDGTEYSGRIVAGVSGLTYFAYRSPIEDALILTTAVRNAGYAVPIRGHVITVEAAIHTVNGTNQVLECDVQYGEVPTGTYWWYKHYPTAVLNQDPPVSLTLYDIFDGLVDARLIFVIARQINDEAAAKVLELTTTIDGEAALGTTATFNNNTWRYWTRDPTRDGRSLAHDTAYNFFYYYAFDFHLGTIQLAMTSAIGTNQQLDGRAVYELYEEVS